MTVTIEKKRTDTYWQNYLKNNVSI